jgi:tRNA 5-methylaminomethyl-2-thiouridine biosynthesis bifunctional protein
MSFGPVAAGTLAFDEDGTPRSPHYGDVYHARAGAWAQAEHVFLRGNGLPGRWRGQRRFTVLETGFGLGNNFLATWRAWRESPQRPGRLDFISVEKHPLRRGDLAQAHRGRHAGEAQPLADALLDAWPPLTPDVHTLLFEGGRVRLLLVFADIAEALPELVARVDAFFLDGFAPARNPQMWDARVLSRLARLAAPGATVATWSVAREVRDGLSAAGFAVEQAPGFGGKREITVGRFAPRHVALPAPGRRCADARHIAVIGAGIAGAGVAQALSREGATIQVFESEASPARHASGNPAGLFHGIVHRDDGPHARWLRAGALRMQQLMRPLFAQGQVEGAFGLLRAERESRLAVMRDLLAAQGLPPEWVQAIEVPRGPAWLYPGGGWCSPVALARAWLGSPGVSLRCGTRVEALRPLPQGWALLDAGGQVLGEAEAVVLANAADAPRLLGDDGPWPLRSQRGQISLLGTGGPDLDLPVADAGYALRLQDQRLLFGATSQADDEDPACRDSDHAHNLAVLERLTDWRPAAGAPWEGRVAWRLQTPDRMPLLGPAPAPAAPAPSRQPQQAREIERRPGLFTAFAYGSRGLTQAALAGEVLAGWLTGAAMPVPARLLDAVDCARFAARLNRKSAS